MLKIPDSWSDLYCCQAFHQVVHCWCNVLKLDLEQMYVNTKWQKAKSKLSLRLLKRVCAHRCSDTTGKSLSAAWQWCIINVAVKWPPHSVHISKPVLKSSHLKACCDYSLKQTVRTKSRWIARAHIVIPKLFPVRATYLFPSLMGAGVSL